VRDPLETVDIDSRRAITYVVLAAAAFVVLGIAKPNVLGTIAVILAFFVMIILHEFGHFVMAKRAGMKVTEFFVGFGPRVWSVRKGETEYGLKAFPLGGYCRIIGMTNIEEVDPEDEPRAYRSKRFLPKLGVALAGSTMHFLIALALIFVVLVAAGDVFTDPTVSTVVHDANGPAAAAMIRPGDKIVAVAGQPVATWDEAVSVIQKRPGQTVPIVVERLGEKVTVNVHLDSHRPGETARVGFAGIAPDVHFKQPGLLKSIALTPVRELDIARQSVAALGHVFSPSGVQRYLKNFEKTPPQSAVSDRPVSVVGFGRLASQAVAAGWVQTLSLLILINMFVGIFNLVPLLPFDGGHAAIAFYEWVASAVRKRRVQVDVAKLMPLTLVVLACLAFLFLSTLFLDVSKPIANPF
jgi:membrane-associated protease RseP (regulator of RpoE activity)